jgi:UDP-glucose 4-epimerase
MILVTGGAGYIGSHTCISLASAGLDFVVVDNFSNAKRSVLGRIARITGGKVISVEADLADVATITQLLREYEVTAVIHFAAFKAVAESVAQPLRYYQNNLVSTIGLLDAMRGAGVGTLVFSSSATVYGETTRVPISEDSPLSASNPYGWSKLMVEQMLADMVVSDPSFWRVARLRYFNPVGAHPSGFIGEDPEGVPNNLLPFLVQVVSGRRPYLNIWGKDYPTPDGTGIRDYIHVMDLADGHLAALTYLASNPGLLTVNLGTGKGTSVLQMVDAMARASGRDVPYQFAPRRPGDVAECWAEPSLAKQLLGWSATRSLDEMCVDAWRWQRFAMGMID